MNKVFCGECKHHVPRTAPLGVPYEFGHWCKSNAADTFLQPAAKWARCDEKNAGNDCGEFERRRPDEGRVFIENVLGPLPKWWEFWK